MEQQKSPLKVPFRILAIFMVLISLGLAAQLLYLRDTTKKLKVFIKETPYIVVDFPEKLRDLPFAEDEGIVLSVKNLKIDGIKHPYNGSLVEKDDGNFLVTFRYDVKHNGPKFGTPFKSYVGIAEFDPFLNQTDRPFQTLETGSDHCEDPRIFKTRDEFFVMYNSDVPKKYKYDRVIKFASLDHKSWALNFSTDLDQFISKVEKNWLPFEYKDQNNDVQQMIIYSANPHKIMRLMNPRNPSMEHLSFTPKPFVKDLFWENIWGSIRGGTPARLINNGAEYISFFHSSFKEESNGSYWYVFGAYTFEAKPPFRITAISPHPILFHGIYQTPNTFTAPKRSKVCFPAGLAFSKQGARDVFLVSCGENDCALKVITIDKENLLKSLKKITYED